MGCTFFSFIACSIAPPSFERERLSFVILSAALSPASAASMRFWFSWLFSRSNERAVSAAQPSRWTPISILSRPWAVCSSL